VHHAVPNWDLQTEVFVPFIVGDAALSSEADERIAQNVFQCDLQPPRLERHSYAEMRAHYWVWKHPPGVDYIGFQHYRRSFVSRASGRSAEIRASAETYRSRDLPTLTRWIAGLLDECDIIVPRKWPALPDLGADYAGSHSAADWQVLLGAVDATIGSSPDLAQGIDYVYRCNMFVMRADLFDAYMNWWDAIMTKVAAAITPPAEGYQSRTFGFMSERLFTMWMAHLPRWVSSPVRIMELPIMIGDFTAI